MFVVSVQGQYLPEEVAVALADRPHLAWLDGDTAGLATSASGKGARSWSFVAAEPDKVVEVPFGTERPMSVLDGFTPPRDVEPPAGAPAHAPSPAEVPLYIGFIAYDATFSGARHTPTWPGGARVESRHALGDTPCLWFGRYPVLYAFNHGAGEGFVIGEDEASTVRWAQHLNRAVNEVRERGASLGAAAKQLTSVSKSEHETAIERALAYIARGDIYQVNLARRWSAEFTGHPLSLFRAMRAASPVPLGAYIDYSDGESRRHCLARTMECFLRWDRVGGRLMTRPIKGTISLPEGEAALAAATEALTSDPKERAEHAMIVDLMRNDLSRVAQVGSVQVEKALAVEPYRKLAHLVSTVTCRPRPEVGLTDVLEATFPPGSVTGAPKSRAVAIIDELEAAPRGVYCGSVGYIDRCGGLSLAVAIRTAQIANAQLTYHAGGGLVEASEPGREVAETELKARVFLDALGDDVLRHGLFSGIV